MTLTVDKRELIVLSSNSNSVCEQIALVPCDLWDHQCDFKLVVEENDKRVYLEGCIQQLERGSQTW